MPMFSQASLDKLATCHPDLQRVAREAIRRIDFIVVFGHRGEADQHEAFLSGHSKLDWPNSRHNSMPAEAMDLAPAPIDWSATSRFYELAAVIKEVAAELGVAISWGGDWAKLKDLDHFELARP